MTQNRPLIAYREAKEKLGISGKPVIIGLYTFLKLSKGFEADQINEMIEKFLPVYVQMLQELEQEGVSWVQVDEPILVTSLTEQEMESVSEIYARLHQAAPKLNLMLQTYFEAVDHYEAIVRLPVQGIGLDFVHGREQNRQALKTHGFPADKILGAGLIDGRNIWRSHYEESIDFLAQHGGGHQDRKKAKNGRNHSIVNEKRQCLRDRRNCLSYLMKRTVILKQEIVFLLVRARSIYSNTNSSAGSPIIHIFIIIDLTVRVRLHFLQEFIPFGLPCFQAISRRLLA